MQTGETEDGLEALAEVEESIAKRASSPRPSDPDADFLLHFTSGWIHATLAERAESPVDRVEMLGRALDRYESARGLRPDDLRTNRNLALVLDALDRSSEALEILTRPRPGLPDGLVGHPDGSVRYDFLLLQGYLLGGRGDLPAAIDSYEAASVLRRGEETPFTRLLELHLRRLDRDAFSEDARAAFEISGRLKASHPSLASLGYEVVMAKCLADVGGGAGDFGLTRESLLRWVLLTAESEELTAERMSRVPSVGCPPIEPGVGRIADLVRALGEPEEIVLPEGFALPLDALFAELPLDASLEDVRAFAARLDEILDSPSLQEYVQTVGSALLEKLPPPTSGQDDEDEAQERKRARKRERREYWLADMRHRYAQAEAIRGIAARHTLYGRPIRAALVYELGLRLASRDLIPASAYESPGVGKSLVVRHDPSTGSTTITGGMDGGGDVMVHEYHTNTITWTAIETEGRWAFDGISISPAGDFEVLTNTSDEIVVVERGDPGTGVFTYQLHLRDLTTGAPSEDPSRSNTIVKRTHEEADETPEDGPGCLAGRPDVQLDMAISLAALYHTNPSLDPSRERVMRLLFDEDPLRSFSRESFDSLRWNTSAREGAHRTLGLLYAELPGGWESRAQYHLESAIQEGGALSGAEAAGMGAYLAREIGGGLAGAETSPITHFRRSASGYRGSDRSEEIAVYREARRYADAVHEDMFALEREVYPDEGFYVGATIGYADGTASGGRLSGALAKLNHDVDVELDDTDIGGRIYAGYRLDQFWAVELSYVNHGEWESTVHDLGLSNPKGLRRSVEQTHPFVAEGISAAVLAYPVSWGRLSPMVKAGLWWWDTDVEIEVDAVGVGEVKVEKDDVAPFFGVGLQYRLGTHFDARIEWEHYELDSDNQNEMLAIGLQYRF